MEIKMDDYRVWTEGPNIFFDGTMRLASSEADAAIVSLLHNILATRPVCITLSVTDLEFINSQGKNLLARFVIEVRKHPEVRLVISGASEVPWQVKALPTLKKLHPALDLVIE